jgi:hypothetical protein
VFLFPRSAIGVEWFERELAAYRALAGVQLSVVPRLLCRWDDPDIYPFPFAAVTRLRGEVPADPEALIEQLGTDSRPLETAFRLRHALRLLADPGDPAVVGTIEEHLADL